MQINICRAEAKPSHPHWAPQKIFKWLEMPTQAVAAANARNIIVGQISRLVGSRACYGAIACAG